MNQLIKQLQDMICCDGIIHGSDVFQRQVTRYDGMVESDLEFINIT